MYFCSLYDDVLTFARQIYPARCPNIEMFLTAIFSYLSADLKSLVPVIVASAEVVFEAFENNTIPRCKLGMLDRSTLRWKYTLYAPYVFFPHENVYAKIHMLKKFAKLCMLKCGYADSQCFQLRRKNVNVSVRTKKRTKADKNVYCVFSPMC